MPKARSAPSKASKKKNARRNQESAASKAVKAEELTDAEQKQLLIVDAPEPTFTGNNIVEDTLFGITKQEYITATEFHHGASESFVDLTVFDYAACPPALAMNAPSPAFSEPPPLTPTNDFLLDIHGNVNWWPSIKEEAFVDACSDFLHFPSHDNHHAYDYLGPQYPSSFEAPEITTNDLPLDLYRNIQPWPTIEEETFAKAYSDFLHIPSQNKQDTVDNVLQVPPQLDGPKILPAISDCKHLDNCRAYTEKNVPPLQRDTPCAGGDALNLPTNQSTKAPKRRQRSTAVITKVKQEVLDHLQSEISMVSKSVADGKRKLKETKKNAKSYKGRKRQPTPDAQTRFFYGWNSPYCRFMRLSRKNASKPLVIEEETLSTGEFICGRDRKDGSSRICVLCYTPDAMPELKEEAESEDRDLLLIPEPSIDISLAIPQNIAVSPSHVLSCPFPLIDHYVQLYPSKAMELSAIPFLNDLALVSL